MKQVSFLLLLLITSCILCAQAPSPGSKPLPLPEQDQTPLPAVPEPVIEAKAFIASQTFSLPQDTPGEPKNVPIPGAPESKPSTPKPKMEGEIEPKVEFPTEAPAEYRPQPYNPNQPKEPQAAVSGEPERWDPDGYEDDDTAATARYISVNSALQSQNHTIEDVGVDVDWYYFYGIPGRTYYFYSTSSLDLYLYLYQDDGTTPIDWDDDDGDVNNFYLEFTPPAYGNYRLKVAGYYMNTGPYVFWFKTGAAVDSWEIDDSAATAGPIFPSVTLTTYNHTIHNATDVDWYSFTGWTGRDYSFYSTGNTDVRAYLYAADGSTQLAYNDDSGGSVNFLIQYSPTQNGTYYLKVEPYTGNAGAYALNFLYGASADGYEPDDINNATSLEANYAYPQFQSHTLHIGSDQDWFNFIALTGRTYHFWSTSNEDVRVGIYENSLVNPIASDDNNGEGNNFDLAFATPGQTWNYSLKVDAPYGAVGAYTIHWRFDTYGDAYEDDDFASDPTLITVTATDSYQAHNLDNWLDQDWYRFYGIPGLMYTLYSTNGQYNTDPMDNQIYLYQDDGATLISFNDDGGDGNNFLLQYSPGVAAYYRFKVIGYNGCTEDYNLHYYYSAVSDGYEADDSATDYTTITPTTADQTQNHTLHSSADQDWFRFSGTAGRLYNFWSEWATDNQIYLYQDDGTTQLQWDDDAGEGWNFNLGFVCATTGYYKLKVIGYSGAVCAYRFHYSYAAVPDEYEDDNSATQYTEIGVFSSDLSQTHTLHTPTDQDWFQFTGEAGKRYTFYSTGVEDTKIFLYQSNGSTQIAEDDDNGDGLNFNLQYVFATTGVYKLKVVGYYGACGTYVFHYFKGTQPDAYEDDDSATDYTALTVTATLQTQNHTLHDALDQDWFRFQGVAGRTYDFSSTGNTDTRAFLYQDDGVTLISSDDDSNGLPNFRLLFQPTTTAYYKLKVEAYPGDAGAYVFNYLYTVLAAPVNVTFTRVGENFLLSWNAVPGATSYKIYHSDNPTAGFIQLGAVSTTSVLISSALPRRFYRVTANN